MRTLGQEKIEAQLKHCDLTKDSEAGQVTYIHMSHPHTGTCAPTDQANRFAPQHSTLTNEFARVRTGTHSSLIANLVPCSHARRPFRRLTSFLTTVIAPCLIYSASGSPVFDHGASEGLMMEENSVSHEERPQRRFPLRGVPATKPLTEPRSPSADRRAPRRYPPRNIRFVQKGNQ
jgi:hypothetical protein